MATGDLPHPLCKKLGIKEGFVLQLVHPPHFYTSLLMPFKKQIDMYSKSAGGYDFIHLFTNSLQELEEALPGLKETLHKKGILWISWYKKSSGKVSELNDTLVRDTGLAVGLVDVKVCAVDDQWSGLKFVFRLKDR
jgi:hypothetical protein